MSDPVDALADLWRWMAEQQFRGYSPIYERIAHAVADDRELLEMLREAPPPAHLPLAPLGAARYLLLDGLDHPLDDVYHGRSNADPGPLFIDLCRQERAALLDLLQTRRVQTNDCGRSALIGPALTWVSQRRPGPFCLVDVGASAGINLLCDRYRIDYGSHGATGPIDSPVAISCEVTGGDPPIVDRLPLLAERVGIDLSPIDLTDPSDARWLLACVWPDTGRADRVEASIRLVQQHPPMLLTGRANQVLPAVLDDLPAGATAIVMTTWAFGYFSIDERTEFVDLLRTASARQPVVWISAENAGVVGELATSGPGSESSDDTLGALLIDGGDVEARPLARVHSHGNWIDWVSEP
ncbi:MAG: DUF2332 domain-containing protein [Ilumatobacteraceae bacterium]